LAAIDQFEYLARIVEPVKQVEAIGHDHGGHIAEVLVQVRAIVSHEPDLGDVVNAPIDESFECVAVEAKGRQHPLVPGLAEWSEPRL